uniref:Bestrophin homolog n=1 Tax=Parascaris univalens TaxID=6257 RepID=A0A914ZX09_PARUN
MGALAAFVVVFGSFFRYMAFYSCLKAHWRLNYVSLKWWTMAGLRIFPRSVRIILRLINEEVGADYLRKEERRWTNPLRIRPLCLLSAFTNIIY